jgi:hypothetical protein
MNAQDRQMVTAALCKLAMASAGQELDAGRIVVYLEQLDADPVDGVLSAIARLTRTARFFPAVGEIVAEMESEFGDKAEIAWNRAISLTRSDSFTIHGAYAANPSLARAVNSVGGMSAMRDRSTRDEPYMKQRFVTAYTANEKLQAAERLSGDSPRRLK